MAVEEKRLHVGGLFDTVTEDELSQRLGKYGKVSSLDIIVRRDSNGKPMKTFAYVNISINDVDYKKCLRAYNGSKWKGTAMSIQEAKQSFLNKLQTERSEIKKKEEAKLKTEPLEVSHEKVRNLMEKGELPTESTEANKNWVKGKSGKILPVVNIRRKDKKKVITVDPTQYEQGIKNLDKARDDGEIMKSNVSQLTWALDENQSETQKKRMGEFPAYTPPKRQKRSFSAKLHSGPKRSRDDEFEVVSVHNSVTVGQGSRLLASSGYNSDSSDEDTPVKPSGSSLPDIVKSTGLVVRNQKRYNNSDSDSDDEGIDSTRRVSVEKNSKSPSMKIGFPTANGTNQKRKSAHSADTFDSGSESDTPMASFKKKTKTEDPGLKSVEQEPNTNNRENDVTVNSRVKKKIAPKIVDRKKTYKNADQHKSGRLPGFGGIAMLETEAEITVKKKKPIRKFDDVKYGANILAELFSSDDSFEDDSDTEGSPLDVEPAVDGSTEAGEKSDNSIQGAIDNLLGLNKGLGLDSTEKAKSTDSDDDNVSSDDDDDDEDDDNDEEEVTNSSEKDKRVDSESSSAESSSDDDSDESDSSDIKTESDGESSKDAEEISSISKSIVAKSTPVNDSGDSDYNRPEAAQKSSAMQTKEKTSKKHVTLQSSVMSEFSSGFLEKLQNKEVRDGQSDSDDDLLDMVASGKIGKVKEYEKKALSDLPGKQGKNQKSRESSKLETGKKEKAKSNIEENLSRKDDKIESRTNEKCANKDVKKSKKDREKTEKKPKTKEEKHLADNERRVESLRQKEQEIKNQKAAIKTALAAIDSNASSSKKIVFDSDSEEESQPIAKMSAASEKQQKTAASAPGSSSSSSEDESDSESDNYKQEIKATAGALFNEGDSDSASSDDEDRFRVRPEYEGELGRKLMSMQRRFKSDDRFKMDARFVDDDSDQDDEKTKKEHETKVEEEDGGMSEKQKALQILGNVLGSNKVKHPEPKKIFKDVSALHYDPTRDDHAQFEIQPDATDEPKKKKKKKKKGESEEEIPEALPEVSGDKFFEVDPSFHAMLASKKRSEEAEKTDSDEESDAPEEEDKAASEKPFSLLSLFGKAQDSVQDKTTEPDVYQYDKPSTKQVHFGGVGLNDDDEEESSDSEDDGKSENVSDRKNKTKNLSGGEMKSVINRFFFVENDPRIEESTSWFKRQEDMEDLREQWAEARPDLIQAYRLKRKRELRKTRITQRLKKKTFIGKKIRKPVG